MSGNFYSGRHVVLLVLQQHFPLLPQLMDVKIMGYMWENRQVKRSKCFFPVLHQAEMAMPSWSFLVKRDRNRN